ncbi:hypothetical protein PIIN_09782 [Serendipita indica DSM 11827]|uniref:Uncharacterized protein n=1 Tax=Serendipita indica (strain DSM 11827) TaxID=1109443 RepID=G4TWV1_SERID|nr:hypothetical protein PIIN_09782 [Serendipita indica DSM 11827]
MRDWKEDDKHQQARVKPMLLQPRLALVCRKFYRILSDMDHNVTVFSCGAPRMLGGHRIEESKRLFFYPSKNSVDPRLKIVQFSDLTFLYVENLQFDLSGLFARSPLLHSLSIVTPYSNLFLFRMLSHSVANQLTHLSLTMETGMWLEPLISLQSLRFLRLHFVNWHDYTSTARSNCQEIVPWTLPRLSSLALCGGMDEEWFVALLPFIERHCDMVIQHDNQLVLAGRSERYEVVTAHHFPALKIYRGWVNELFAVQSNSNTLPDKTLPLTMLLGSESVHTLSTRINGGDAVPSGQLGIRLAGTHYIVNRVMMCESWETTAQDLGIPIDQAHIFAIRWLISRGIRVVDCHEVDFDDFTGSWPKPAESTHDHQVLADENQTQLATPSLPVYPPTAGMALAQPPPQSWWMRAVEFLLGVLRRLRLA